MPMQWPMQFLFRNEQVERNIKMLVDMGVVQTRMSDCGNSSNDVKDIGEHSNLLSDSTLIY